MKFRTFPLSSLLALVPVLVACSGDTGAQGAQGATGTQGPSGASAGAFEPTVRVAVPSTGILDRRHDVMLVGSGTRFEQVQAGQVSFGDGIQVSDVKVASSTTIRCTVTVAPDAAIGPRDVTVGTYVAKSGFSVAAAISVSSLANESAQIPAEQGSVVRLDVTNHDAYAFDTRVSTTAFQVLVPGTIHEDGSALTSTFAEWYALVAPLAAEGLVRVRAENYDDVGAVSRSFLSAPDAVRITKRDPAAVAFRTAKTGELFPSRALASLSYRGDLPAGSPSIVEYRLRVSDAGVAPRLHLFGPAGRTEDLLATVDAPGTAPPFDVRVVLPHGSTAQIEPSYLVVVDPSGAGAHKFDFLPSRISATADIESAIAHGTQLTAQALGVLQSPPAFDSNDVGAHVIQGTLAADEIDVYAFSTTVDNDRVELAVLPSADVSVFLTATPDVLAGPGTRAVGDVQSGRLGRVETTPSGAAALGVAGTYYAVVKSRTKAASTYTASLRRLP